MAEYLDANRIGSEAKHIAPSSSTEKTNMLMSILVISKLIHAGNETILPLCSFLKNKMVEMMSDLEFLELVQKVSELREQRFLMQQPSWDKSEKISITAMGTIYSGNSLEEVVFRMRSFYAEMWLEHLEKDAIKLSLILLVFTLNSAAAGSGLAEIHTHTKKYSKPMGFTLHLLKRCVMCSCGLNR